MNRLAYSILGVFVLAGAPSLRAQQVNPRVPPPPPPAADSTASHNDAPANSAGPAASSAHDDAKAQPLQRIDPTVPPPPPPAEAEEDASEASTPAAPAFDPLHAQRSLDVGKFYLNKGNYDAAIDRFIESSNYQPSLAAPWKMLGEAYEKKHEYSKAADAYNKYLNLLPHAPDAAKIKKTVADLQEKSAQDSPKKSD